MKIVVSVLVCGTTCVVSPAAQSQAYPAKPQ